MCSYEEDGGTTCSCVGDGVTIWPCDGYDGTIRPCNEDNSTMCLMLDMMIQCEFVMEMKYNVP